MLKTVIDWIAHSGIPMPLQTTSRIVSFGEKSPKVSFAPAMAFEYAALISSASMVLALISPKAASARENSAT